jgi:hypothetical protein
MKQILLLNVLCMLDVTSAVFFIAKSFCLNVSIYEECLRCFCYPFGDVCVFVCNNCLVKAKARWSSGQCARRAIAEAKHRSQWPVLGWVTKIYYLELLRASEGTLSRWSRLHLQSLAPTNPHWVRVVGYGPFFLWVIHKEGLCPSSGDINRLMMIL